MTVILCGSIASVVFCQGLQLSSNLSGGQDLCFAGLLSQRFVSCRSTSRLQFGPDYLKQRGLAAINGVRGLLRKGKVRDRDRLRLAAIAATFRFVRTARASCGVSALIATRVLSTRRFVRCGAATSARVGRLCQIVFVRASKRWARAVPVALRVGKGFVKDLKFMIRSARANRLGVLLRNFRRELQDVFARVHRRPIMIRSNRFSNQRACYRRVIMFNVEVIFLNDVNRFLARRNYNDQAIVSIHCVRQERHSGLTDRRLGVIFVLRRPGLVSRAISEYGRVVGKLDRNVLNGRFYRCHVIEVDRGCQFSVNVNSARVLRAIFFLVLTNRFIFLGRPIRMILRQYSRCGAVLHAPIRNLYVSMMREFFVLRRPAILLRLNGVLNDLLMGAQYVLIHAFKGVGLKASSVVGQRFTLANLLAYLFQIRRVM